MERDFLPSSRTVVERKPVQSPLFSGNPTDLNTIANLSVSKDGQEPSFEDVLKKAYGDFPKLKMHADLHPSEYKNAIDLINELSVQLQDKWRLLRLCLWNQYGSSTFGAIFDFTPDKTRKEITLLSDLPDKLTSKISKLLEDDREEEEAAENTTTVLFLNKYNGRVNPEKRDFVILAEGGSKWSTLTDNQRIVLQERYLVDHQPLLRILLDD